jgi:lipoprotein-anchoring transpeptidase ErfK/SrfK
LRKCAFTWALILATTWPGAAKATDPQPGVLPDPAPRQVVTHFFSAGTGDLSTVQTVIGSSRLYRVKTGETFLDIALGEDLGYNELVAGNPGVDPWLPEPGSEVLLPSEWILPRGGFEGIIVNIPEMRLYFFVPSPRSDAQSSMVVTYPVGLGQQDWQTPQGEFRIRGKTRNPAWVLPDSIKQQRIRDFGSSEEVVPGGHPDNPLGRYRLELTLPTYAIHGTNKTWGVGMQVSHGCVRMYPADIAALFPMVPVGAKGHFVYQPIKVGLRAGRVMIEVHEDIYGVMPWPFMLAQDLLKEMGLEQQIDRQRLEAALEAATGIPTDIGHVSWPSLVEAASVTFDATGNPVEPYPPVSAP